MFATKPVGDLALVGRAQDPITFGELQVRIGARCAQLRRAGVLRGSRVAVIPGTDLEAVVDLLAVLRCAIAIPLNPGYREAEFARALSFLKADLLLDGNPAATAAAHAVGVTVAHFGIPDSQPWTEPPRGPDEVVLVMQTSGTEGDPKRVPLTHGNLRASIRAIQESMQLTSQDRFLCMARLHHIAGLALLLASLDKGSPNYYAPGIPSATFFEAFEAFQPTWFWAAPAILTQLLRFLERAPELAPLKRSRLRLIRSGSAPLPPQTLETAERVFGVPVLENYGMTEAAPQITSNPLPPAARKPGSAGIPAGPEVRIADDGEIEIRGASVTAGYEDDAASESFRDGWFRTGDIGRFDDDGYLFLLGRRRESINRGGEKIWPREVEDVLLAHPQVAEAVVFPVPHPVLTQDVAAAVVPRAEALTERALHTFTAARLSTAKVPSRFVILEEIPKGPGGKPQRHLLAERLGVKADADSGNPTAEFVEPGTPLERRLAAIWSRVLGVERIGIHDNFFDLGGDSFAVTAMFAEAAHEIPEVDGLRARLDFFYTPTIASQLHSLGTAAPVAAKAMPPEVAYLSPSHTGSAGEWVADQQRPPVFAIPWADSNGLYMTVLAKALGDDWPFCVLANQGGTTTVEELATRFRQAIQQVQPQGPYAVVGHCFGGVVAYEIARQLLQSGQQVRLLAIFDSPVPHYPSLRRHAHLFAAGFVFHAWQALRDRHTLDRLKFAAGALVRHIRKHRTQPGTQSAEPLIGSDLLAMRLYRPQPLHANALVLVADNHPQTGSPLDRRIGWRELIVPTPQILRIAGDHGSILMGEQVTELAERFVSALKRSS